MDYIFKKISKDEFFKLHDLFPDNEDMWKKYVDIRMKQFKENDVDVYVIEKDNNFIGEVTVNYSNRTLKTETIPNIRIYFEAFRVSKKYQGLGLGQKLMSYAIDDLKSRGYTEFTIGVSKDNDVAKHIYEKLGFNLEIDKGYGDEFDSTDYILYLKSLNNLMILNGRDIGVKEIEFDYEELHVYANDNIHQFYIHITNWNDFKDIKLLEKYDTLFNEYLMCENNESALVTPTKCYVIKKSSNKIELNFEFKDLSDAVYMNKRNCFFENLDSLIIKVSLDNVSWS